MIDVKYYGLIEMVMTFAIVGGFVIHQLWTLRDKGDGGDSNDKDDDDDDK